MGYITKCVNVNTICRHTWWCCFSIFIILSCTRSSRGSIKSFMYVEFFSSSENDFHRSYFTALRKSNDLRMYERTWFKTQQVKRVRSLLMPWFAHLLINFALIGLSSLSLEYNIYFSFFYLSSSFSGYRYHTEVWMEFQRV